jgi:hypothetical protein
MSSGPFLHHARQGEVPRLPDPQAARGPGFGSPRRDAETHAALRRQVPLRPGISVIELFSLFVGTK